MIVIKLIVFAVFVGLSFAVCGWKLAVAIAFCGLVALIALITNSTGNRSKSTPTKATKAVQPTKAISEKEKRAVINRIVAQKDLEYYGGQIEDLYKREQETANKYYSALDRVKTDKELNSLASGVISEKIYKKHVVEMERAYKAMVAAGNAVHSAEKRITKAKYIIEN